MPYLFCQHFFDFEHEVTQKELFFGGGVDQFEDEADFGRVGDADVLTVEECDAVTDEGLELEAEVAVVPVVDLALDLGVGKGLVSLEGVDCYVDKVLLVCYPVHGLGFRYIITATEKQLKTVDSGM